MGNPALCLQNVLPTIVLMVFAVSVLVQGIAIWELAQVEIATFSLKAQSVLLRIAQGICMLHSPVKCLYESGCRYSCSNDGQCQRAAFCDTKGDCVDDYDLGDTCGRYQQCSSDKCVDGMCCNWPCTNICVHCVNGFCVNVPSGEDPRGDCNALPSDICGYDGTCDGNGQCGIALPNTLCKEASCEEDADGQGKYIEERYCDGDGTCVVGAEISCITGYGCKGNVSCHTNCSSQVDCASTYYCDENHQCQPKVVFGQTCSKDEECLSNICTGDAIVPGVCCDMVCDAPCMSCTLSGTYGQCVPMQQGMPSSGCVASPPCGLNGMCDSTGSCEFSPQTQMCVAELCLDGEHFFGQYCSGDGVCSANDNTSELCYPFVCDDGGRMCRTMCSDSSACVLTHYCGGSSCVPKLVNGSSCFNGQQCLSGWCVDGSCCASLCDGFCEECSSGDCLAIPEGIDPEGECIGPDQCWNGNITHSACTGNKSCGYAGVSVPCSQGSGCASSSACASNCTPPTTGCTEEYFCDTNVCALLRPVGSSCPFTEACQDNSTCVDGVCCQTLNCSVNERCSALDGVCRFLDGQSCSVDNDCVSHYCVKNVCCDLLCENSCMQCAIGVCDFVASGTDPAGDCQAWTSCEEGQQTVGVCDGVGQCNASFASACPDGLACDALGRNCLEDCATDAMCQFGYFCNTTEQCVPRLSLGNICDRDRQCAVNSFCSPNHVCCDDACTDPCQHCNATGQCLQIPVGTVTPECNDYCLGAAIWYGFCSSSGGCTLASTPQSCFGDFLCKNQSACSSECTIPSIGCIANRFCCSGACLPLLADGVACPFDEACVSEHCVDGFCCPLGCNTTCGDCPLGSDCSVATCANELYCVAGRCCITDCVDEGPCGRNGQCVASGLKCQTYPDGSECGAQACAVSTIEAEIPPWTCESGVCEEPKYIKPCDGHFACISGACGMKCTSNGDCEDGYGCTGGDCVESDALVGDTTLSLANGGCSSPLCYLGVPLVGIVSLVLFWFLYRRNKRTRKHTPSEKFISPLTSDEHTLLPSEALTMVLSTQLSHESFDDVPTVRMDQTADTLSTMPEWRMDPCLATLETLRASDLSFGSSVDIVDLVLLEKELQPTRVKILKEDAFVVGAPIGRGAFGTLHLATCKEDQVVVAIKRLVADCTPETAADFVEELRSLAVLRHANVLDLHSVIIDPLCINTVFCKDGTVWNKIHPKGVGANAPPQPPSLRVALKWGCDLCRALTYLHGQHVIHRDLKPQNFLLHDETLVLADFGLALRGCVDTKRTRKMSGTPCYMAPESLLNRCYSPASDVFAFGVCMWEMIGGKVPWYGESLQEMIQHAEKGDRLEPLENVNKELNVLLDECFSKAEDRPDAEDILPKLKKMLREIH